MGYYSTMEGDIEFKSDLSLEELRQLLGKEKTARGNSLSDNYELNNDDNGKFSISPVQGEYYAKHYDSETLERFISKVILPSTYAKTAFTGEDGERYGSLIFRKEIFPVSWEPTVENKPLEDFIKEKLPPKQKTSAGRRN